MTARRFPAVAALLMVAACLPPAAARAQGIDMAGQSGQPIEVYADNGIEWSQDGRRFIAHGNAKAVRGRITVTADTLTAHYREQGSANDIYRLDAEGKVTIASPTETMTGSAATYDMDKAILVMKGSPVRLTTPTDVVTANDTMEYWEKKRMAVARGDALAVRADKRIKADVLTAYFKESGPKRDLRLDTTQAFGNVVLTTTQDVVTGERGDYNAETGIATLTGSVKITRAENQLNGGYAVVNMNSGVSRLFPAPPGGGGGGRVQGLFVPERKDGASGGPGGETPPKTGGSK